VSVSSEVYRFHTTLHGPPHRIRRNDYCSRYSVQILANAIDWYFMIAAPTVLAVIALRATGLSRR